MHIKLSQIIAEVNSSKTHRSLLLLVSSNSLIEVYAIDGRINRTFLLSTKAALANIASLADELREAVPLHLDREVSGVSRTSASLHLLYHQACGFL
jgi:hypothetical protein